MAYRKVHGLGSYTALVKVANGALSDDEIRSMAAAGSFPLAKWKLLAAALDYIEKQEE